MLGRRSWRRAGVPAAALIAVGMLLVACADVPSAPTPTASASESRAPGDGILRIGTLLPTSGDDTSHGPGLVAAVRAAVREINVAGGVLGERVELVSRSSGGDLAGAEAAVAELIAAGVDAIVGPTEAPLAVRAAQLASEAGIPVMAVATGSPQVASADDDDWLFRTTPGLAVQGAALGAQLVADGARSVALVTVNGPDGMPILDGLGPAVRAGGGEIVSVQRIDYSTPADAFDRVDYVDIPTGVAMRLAELAPDAVVVATADGGEATQRVLRALAELGPGDATVWLASGSAVDYSDTDADEAVASATAIRSGVQGDADFQRRVRQEDPGAKNLSYAADAYDATMLLGLAAVAAGGDAGWQLRTALRGVSAEGTDCTSFGECIVILSDGHDLDYEGVSGPIEFTAVGDVGMAAFGLFSYSDRGELSWTSDLVG